MTSQGSKPTSANAEAISRSPLLPSSRIIATSAGPCGPPDGGPSAAGEGDHIARTFAVVAVLPLFADILGITLQQVELVARLLPDVPKHPQVLVKDAFPAEAYLDALFLHRRSDHEERHLGLVQYFEDLRFVLRQVFNDQARLFGEQCGERIAAVHAFGRKIHVDAAVPGKGHLEQRGDEASVGTVVAGKNEALADQLLHGIESLLQESGILDVRRLIADLAEHLGKRRAAQAVLPAAQIDEQEPAPCPAS